MPTGELVLLCVLWRGASPPAWAPSAVQCPGFGSWQLLGQDPALRRKPEANAYRADPIQILSQHISVLIHVSTVRWKRMGEYACVPSFPLPQGQVTQELGSKLGWAGLGWAGIPLKTEQFLHGPVLLV